MSGWNSEIGDPNQIYSRSPTTTRVEVAVPLSLLGLTAMDLLSSDLLWAYAGVATSNPSASSTLFGNDQWRFAPGKGVEYDTLRFGTTSTPVPEPGSLILFGSGLAAVAARVRSRRRSRR
jgi:PEP-CTERM motif